MRQVIAGATDQTIGFRAYEADGTPIVLAHNSAGMAVYYRVDTNGRRGTRVAMTPLVARSGAGVHTDKSVTNMGSSEYHEVDLPDAAVATAGTLVFIEIEATALAAGTITTVEPLQVGPVRAELDSAVETQIDNIENAAGYLLAWAVGACADPQTASETYAITVFGSTFTVDMAGQTSTGTRTAPTLTKS